MNSPQMVCVACGNQYPSELRICPCDHKSLLPINADRRVGSILNERYEIIATLKSGGMGTVYQARQLMMNRIVAIKMLHQNMLTNIDALKRFRLEAQAASRLGMPNILTIYDFGLTPEGQPYMVMPFLDGVSLDEVMLKEHRLKPLRMLDISIQICAALSHAHANGVLHRDIKPSNIMLINDDDRTDFVKIVDFGIAKIIDALDTASSSITKTGELYGSPAYMSPEQCHGSALDARSDIYSLGCLMYTALTGHNFFASDCMLQTMQKHLSEMPSPFSQVCPGVDLPHDLEAAVFKSLAKKPAERFQTMSQFKEELKAIRQKMLSADAVKQEQKDAQLNSIRSAHVLADVTQPRREIVDQVVPTSAPATAAENAAVLGADSAAIPASAARTGPSANSGQASGLGPTPFKILTLHSKKLVACTLAFVGLATLATLGLGHASTGGKPVASSNTPPPRQYQLLPAVSSKTNVLPATKAKLSDVTGKHLSVIGSTRKVRIARRHSSPMPTSPFVHDEQPRYDNVVGSDGHRHAYSSYR
jgi:serine/threonine-protein kinase